MTKLKQLAIVLLAVLVGVLANAPATAQEHGKLILGGDYDSLRVGRGADAWRKCSRTCAGDPRCKAWTYIRRNGQCRLKRKKGVMVSHRCCVSGVRSAIGGQNKAAFCRKYANDAVDANQENLALGCGYRGARWSDAYNGHYRWCMRVRRPNSSRETDARTRLVAQCRTSVQQVARAQCAHYVRLYMVQARSARKANCGFRGVIWREDAGALNRWCMSASPTARTDALKSREAKLQKCFVGGGKIDDQCLTYANNAVSQVKAAGALKCPITKDAKWSSDLWSHYQWCTGATPAQRRRLNLVRTNTIEDCKIGDGGTAFSSCRGYVRLTMDQVARAAKASCGFSGARWSDNRRVHRRACRRTRMSELRRIAAKRADELERCEGRFARRAKCKSFVDSAVDLADRADEIGCGLRGDSWSLKRATHMNFCLGASDEDIEDALSDRRRALRRCQGGASRRATCETYAKKALTQVRAAINAGCGVSGPSWAPTLNRHIRFCMAATDEQLGDAHARRTALLRRCTGGSTGGAGGDGAYCDAYARRAVSASRANRKYRCARAGAGNPLWNARYNYHYRVCKSQPGEARRAQIRRARRLAICGAVRGLRIEY